MKLFCWHEHRIHPYFRIGPLQVELLSMHPNAEVVMIHKALTQRLLAFLRNDTGRLYSVCRFMEPKVCLHYTWWTHKDASENDLRLHQLAGRISGLKPTERPILIVTHPPGGYHAVHTDSVRLLFLHKKLSSAHGAYKEIFMLR